MRLLWEVIDDLYQFAFGAIRMILRMERHAQLPVEHPLHNEVSLSAPILTSDAMPDAPHEEIVEAPTFRPVTEIIAENYSIPEFGGTETLYVTREHAPVFRNAVPEFDGAVAVLPYGSSVTVIGRTDHFVQVSTQDKAGYMHAHDLSETTETSHPEFVVGVPYGAEESVTIRVRALLKDMFLGGELEFPLQAGEYVSYRLMAQGVHIPWPPARPRLPGRWHTILRGIPGVHSGVIPKTGSVMEFLLPNDIGHVAYVEAVFPNETIMISECNIPGDGIYNERTLTREEWRELKPVFMSII